MENYFTITDSYNSIKISIEFDIQENNWNNYLNVIKPLSLSISSYIFIKLGLNEYASSIEYSIILTNSPNIQKINHQYRLKNKPTNVLSFPAEEIEANKFNQLQIHDRFVMLGDIIFAYEVIKEEAEEKNISFKDHFTHLLVHAILHCLGYDHEDEKEANIMENLEIDILSYFNIDSPYECTTKK